MKRTLMKQKEIFKSANTLVVIEQGNIKTYSLDDRLKWNVGRPSKENMPDIRLHARTVSRQQGCFENVDGIWFYVDSFGKNPTFLNGKKIEKVFGSGIRPVLLEDRDVLIFGGGDRPDINPKTVWAVFFERMIDDSWRVEDTNGIEKLSFSDGSHSEVFKNSHIGMIIDNENGIAIYMGDITYLNGNINVTAA